MITSRRNCATRENPSQPTTFAEMASSNTPTARSPGARLSLSIMVPEREQSATPPVRYICSDVPLVEHRDLVEDLEGTGLECKADVDASCIIPGVLWVGGLQSSRSPEALLELGIRRVLTLCAKDCFDETPQYPGIEYHELDMVDDPEQDLSAALEKFFELLCQDTRPLLVHCIGGVSRSASLAIGFLVRRLRLCLLHAFSWVKKRRPIIWPNVGFRWQLAALASTDQSAFFIDPPELPRTKDAVVLLERLARNAFSEDEDLPHGCGFCNMLQAASATRPATDEAVPVVEVERSLSAGALQPPVAAAADEAVPVVEVERSLSAGASRPPRPRRRGSSEGTETPEDQKVSKLDAMRPAFLGTFGDRRRSSLGSLSSVTTTPPTVSAFGVDQWPSFSSRGSASKDSPSREGSFSDALPIPLLKPESSPKRTLSGRQRPPNPFRPPHG